MLEQATLNMDTYKVVQLLQDKGYSLEEAEGFIAAMQEITLTGVATKQDIILVKQDITSVKEELRTEIKTVDEKIDSLRLELKGGISQLNINLKDSIINLQKTMMATVLGGVGLTVALIKLL